MAESSNENWLQWLDQMIDNVRVEGPVEIKRKVEVALPGIDALNDPIVRGNADLVRSVCMMVLGEMDEARKLLDGIAAVFPTDSALYEYYLSSEMRYYMYREQKVEALPFALRCVESASQSGDPLRLTRALGKAGSLYYEMDDFEKASEYLLQSISLGETIPQDQTQPANLFNMGQLLMKMGQADEAEAYWKRSLAASRAINDLQGVVNSMNTLAHVADIKGDLLTAKQTLQESLEISKAHNLVMGLHNGLLHLTAVLGNLGEVDASVNSANALVEVTQNLRPSNLAVAYAQRGAVYREIGRLDEALVDLILATRYAEESGGKGLIALISEELSKCYRAQGRFSEALEAYEKYHKFRAEIESGLLQKRVQEFEMRLRMERSQRELEQSQREADRLNLVLSTKEAELLSTAVALISQTELLSELRKDLLQIARRIPPSDPGAKELKERLKDLPCKSVDWIKFEAKFVAAHPDFTKNLKERYPDLSPMEVRICSLLKMNLKSEEIAGLFCLSPRSVEFHRYNIRKKLSLKKEQALPQFLAAF